MSRKRILFWVYVAIVSVWGTIITPLLPNVLIGGWFPLQLLSYFLVCIAFSVLGGIGFRHLR